MFDELKRQYTDTGKVRYLSRNLPLPGLHPLTVTAARATSYGALDPTSDEPYTRTR